MQHGNLVDPAEIRKRMDEEIAKTKLHGENRLLREPPEAQAEQTREAAQRQRQSRRGASTGHRGHSAEASDSGPGHSGLEIAVQHLKGV